MAGILGKRVVGQFSRNGRIGGYHGGVKGIAKVERRGFYTDKYD